MKIMPKGVIKKSGKKQRFDSKKIKRCIGKVCERARIPKKKTEEIEKEIVDEIVGLAEKKELTTAEIRDIVLRDLSKLDPAVVRAWIAFEIMKIQKKIR